VTARRMRVLGIIGWSGSGKTTLITSLIPMLVAGGHRVSTVKHAHHGFEIDRPGKDSHRHREAGAQEVLIASERRWALLHELRDDSEPPLDALLAKLAPVDLVLVEGFKAFPHPKLEVHRPSLGRPPLWTADPHVAAVASDTTLPGCGLPVLPLDDPTQVCHWITQFITDVRGEA
jgi:molybdopterin-guanine dinucleotide biosynthesis adapter protein